jgi:hypothetical protein
MPLFKNQMHSFNFVLAISCAVILTGRAAVNPALPVIPDNIFNATNYGAMGDGITTNTAAIQSAINAANSAHGGIVEIPAGIFLSGPIRSPVLAQLMVRARLGGRWRKLLTTPSVPE